MKDLAKQTFEQHESIQAVLITQDHQVFDADENEGNAAYVHARSRNFPLPTRFERSEVMGEEKEEAVAVDAPKKGGKKGKMDVAFIAAPDEVGTEDKEAEAGADAATDTPPSPEEGGEKDAK